MPSPFDRIDAAIARLTAALDALEGAQAQRFEAEAARIDYEEELAIMRDDRNQLAQELDTALAAAGGLEKARDEVLRRLAAAGAEVRAALGESEGR